MHYSLTRHRSRKGGWSAGNRQRDRRAAAPKGSGFLGDSALQPREYENSFVTSTGDSLKGRNMVRILIADDHTVVRWGLRTLLETHQGWEVCGEAATGEDAVAAAKRLKPDVIIMDISMPGINGFEAMRQIRTTAPEIGILTLTMHDSEPMFRGAMMAGAQGYVLKSDVDKRLIEAVEAICEHRAFFSSGVSHAILQDLFNGNGHRDKVPVNGSCLTPRQRQVLKLLASGKTNKEAACALGISTRTVETHRRQIMSRLEVQTLSELVLFAVRNHIVEL